MSLGAGARVGHDVVMEGALFTLARGVALLGLSGFASQARVAPAHTPAWVVQVACPAAAPPTSPGPRPPSWSVPFGGRPTLLFATLVDLRFP